MLISPRVRKKLAEKHQVTEEEIRQCFLNFEGNYLRDLREDHQTDPPTWWFVSETNRRRKLKVVFIARKVETADGPRTQVEIKTAYPPDLQDIELYERRGQC